MAERNPRALQVKSTKKLGPYAKSQFARAHSHCHNQAYFAVPLGCKALTACFVRQLRLKGHKVVLVTDDYENSASKN